MYTSMPCLMPDPMTCVRWCQVPPYCGRCCPTNPSDMAVPSNSGFLISDSGSGAMVLLRDRPGRNPCSACRCCRRRRSGLSFSFLEALSRPSSTPLCELRGNPRSSSPDRMARGGGAAAFSFLKALYCRSRCPRCRFWRCWTSSLFGLPLLFEALWV